MSGSGLVASVRSQQKLLASGRSDRLRWAILAIGSAVSVIGFGSIVVTAADDAGVYTIARQYSTSQGVPRFQLPQIFRSAPSAPSRSVTSYAPAYGALPTQATGKRSVDRANRSASRTVKITPTPGRDDADFAESYLSARTSYCVRSCDGFYFPIGNPDNGSLAAHEDACARACPASNTSVYVANAGTKGIDDAVNRKGLRYQATQTAFNYRTQLDPACTCTGGAGTARNHSLLTDYTLRSGDLVMSREGLKVFRSSDAFPHKSSEFVSADNASLSATERRWAQSSEASSVRGLQGAKISASLQARIATQLKKGSGLPLPAEIGLRGFERTISVSEGRQMRYVGPDKATVLR